MSFVPFQRDELMRIRERAEGVVGLNCLVPTWQRAYLALADAADHLDAMESRTSGVGGFPPNVPDQPAAAHAQPDAVPVSGSVASDGSADALDSFPLPSQKDLFYASLANYRVLHELCVRLTGGGFTIHDYRGLDGNDRPSCMAIPLKITFETDK